MDAQHGQGQTAAVNLALVNHNRAADHKGRLKTGAAHINHNTVFLIVGTDILQARTGPRRRTGQQGQGGFCLGNLRCHHPAVGLHDQQNTLEANVFQAGKKLVQIMVQYGADIAVQDRGADPLIKTNGGQQI